ncbi:MAG: hypothetical protein AAGC60_19980 [Acidobacteriota bacterium]
MSLFGETLFGESRFVRWALTPVVLVALVVLGMLFDATWTPRSILVGFLALAAGCLLAGFWLPRAHGLIAFRILSALVVVAYLAYFIELFWIRGEPLAPSGRSSASPLGALFGLVVIGWPCLKFALLGRWSLRPEPEPKPKPKTGDGAMVEDDEWESTESTRR